MEKHSIQENVLNLSKDGGSLGVLAEFPSILHTPQVCVSKRPLQVWPKFRVAGMLSLNMQMGLQHLSPLPPAPTHALCCISAVPGQSGWRYGLPPRHHTEHRKKISAHDISDKNLYLECAENS